MKEQRENEIEVEQRWTMEAQPAWKAKAVAARDSTEVESTEEKGQQCVSLATRMTEEAETGGSDGESEKSGRNLEWRWSAHQNKQKTNLVV